MEDKKLKEDYTISIDYYENAYRYSIWCRNCNHNNKLQIKKGVRVPEEITCEKCGCSTGEPLWDKYLRANDRA